MAHAFDGESKQVEGVVGLIDPPTGDTPAQLGPVRHRVDDQGGLAQLVGGEFAQMVHHRFDYFDEVVRPSALCCHDRSHDHASTRSPGASVAARHPSTLVAPALAWTIMRERHPVERLCSKSRCPHTAQATLTYVYADQEAVVGPLSGQPEPHSYDLCEQHAQRLTAPVGWSVVRYRAQPDFL